MMLNAIFDEKRRKEIQEALRRGKHLAFRSSRPKIEMPPDELPATRQKLKSEREDDIYGVSISVDIPPG